MRIKHLPLIFILICICSLGCKDSPSVTNGTGDKEEVKLRDYQLTADETWDPEKTYIIHGTLVVPSNTTLEILPGTIVKFDSDAFMRVSGLNAILKIGTPLTEASMDEPVLLTSNDSNPQPSDWKGILFDHTKDNVSYFRGVVIEYAEVALDFQSTSPSVIDCTIQKNVTAFALNGSDSVIRYNDILDNEIGISTIERQNKPQIEFNNIKNNATGIFCENVQSIIQFNNLEFNDFALRLNVKFVLSVTDNWWGTIVEDDIDKVILDSKDTDIITKTLGTVIYTPFAETRFTDAGPR